MRNTAFASQRGINLVETMLIASFLTVGVMSLVMAFYSSVDLMNTSKNYALGVRAADMVMETLKSEKRFDLLYQNYKIFDNAGPTHRFYILEDKSIDWSRPDKAPKDALGEGYLNFVINETKYNALDWGTDTAFSTGGQVCPGQIDLDGNRKIEDRDLIVGRTSETSWKGNQGGYYIILPVKVTLRIYGGSKGGDTLIERKFWLLNSNGY